MDGGRYAVRHSPRPSNFWSHSQPPALSHSATHSPPTRRGGRLEGLAALGGLRFKFRQGLFLCRSLSWKSFVLNFSIIGRPSVSWALGSAAPAPPHSQPQTAWSCRWLHCLKIDIQKMRHISTYAKNNTRTQQHFMRLCILDENVKNRVWRRTAWTKHLGGARVVLSPIYYSGCQTTPIGKCFRADQEGSHRRKVITTKLISLAVP